MRDLGEEGVLGRVIAGHPGILKGKSLSYRCVSGVRGPKGTGSTQASGAKASLEEHREQRPLGPKEGQTEAVSSGGRGEHRTAWVFLSGPRPHPDPVSGKVVWTAHFIPRPSTALGNKTFSH